MEDVIGHCADGQHYYCGGSLRDAGDGTVVECACACHGRRRMWCEECGAVMNHDTAMHRAAEREEAL